MLLILYSCYCILPFGPTLWGNLYAVKYKKKRSPQAATRFKRPFSPHLSLITVIPPRPSRSPWKMRLNAALWSLKLLKNVSKKVNWLAQLQITDWGAMSDFSGRYTKQMRHFKANDTLDKNHCLRRKISPTSALLSKNCSHRQLLLTADWHEAFATQLQLFSFFFFF